MTPEVERCRWCGKPRRQWSAWEQESLTDGWHRLCKPCVRVRLDNPYNALLRMRKVEVADE